MPGTVLSTLHIRTHSILMTTLQGASYCCLRCTDRETEATNSQVTPTHPPKAPRPVGGKSESRRPASKTQTTIILVVREKADCLTFQVLGVWVFFTVFLSFQKYFDISSYYFNS